MECRKQNGHSKRKSPRTGERMGARKGFGKLFFDFFSRNFFFSFSERKGIFSVWGWENGDFGMEWMARRGRWIAVGKGIKASEWEGKMDWGAVLGGDEFD